MAEGLHDILFPMKPIYRMVAVGVVMTGLGLMNGCLDLDFKPTIKAVGHAAHETVRMAFAIELYVAKKGEAPGTTADLTAFLSSEKIPLQIDASWQVEAHIKDGQCAYKFERAKESMSGSFSTAGMDYDKTLQTYLDLEELWASYRTALNKSESGGSGSK